MSVKDKMWFWDIESYNNFFCVVLMLGKQLEMHYLVNSEEDETSVLKACQDSGFPYKAYDLSKDATRLQFHFEKIVPREKNTLLANFLGIQETEIKPKEYWYNGFNTLNYDIPMIDFLLKSVVNGRVQTTTMSLRQRSDELINDSAPYTNVKDYELYANQIDTALLNETQYDKGRPKLGLKTLVGIKGGAIIESESNKSGYSKNIYDDSVYCINDVTELRDIVYPGYLETKFNTRYGLLQKYSHLREHRLTVNSTSAKFVEFIVSPDKPVDDYPTVDFTYPAKHVAEKYGIEQINMLDYTVKWYMDNVYAQVSEHNKKVADTHLAKFMSIINFYRQFEGRNWNDSGKHLAKHGIPASTKEERRALLQDFGTHINFIDKYGNDSGTFVNFSYGGIHGMEYNEKQLMKDRKKIAELKQLYGYISKIPKGKVTQKLLNLIKAQSREPYQGYPVRFSHEIGYFIARTEMVDEIVDPEEFTPFMYSNKDKSEKLLERYKYTSSGHTIHQDFAGYYPKLMINLGCFYDGNGKDVYEEIYNLRIGIKAKLKDLKFGSLEWFNTNVEQEGYKLILNSASGVLDGSFDTNLRANNKAMTMRIIGQLITYILAQALALEGANIPSSNTDGIYVSNIDADLNKTIVDRELSKLLIEIDPEDVMLISKDSNNRLEAHNGKVVSARGGSLTSWQGPRVDNNLSHPALLDAAMTYYLQNENILDKPVDINIVKSAYDKYKSETDKRKFVMMASWVMRSTSGSIFIDSNDEVHPGTIRSWLTNDGVTVKKYKVKSMKNSKNVKLMADRLFDDTKLGDSELVMYLTDKGILDKYFQKANTVEEYYQLTEANPKTSVKVVVAEKVQGLEENAKLYFNNHSLLNMTDEDIDNIYNHLDDNAYVNMLAATAVKWHNVLEPVE